MSQNTNDSLQEKSGVVIELLPNATFRIKMDEDEKEVIAYVSGKMRKNRIRVLLGDKVRVAFSSYDLQRGRIIYRSK